MYFTNVRTFAVSIPTKTHIRKYVHSINGHTIVAGHDTLIGSVMMICLANKVTSHTTKEYREARIKTYPDRVQVIVPAHYVFNRHVGLTLSEDSIITINRFLENAFLQDLYRYCRTSINPLNRRHGYDRSIEEFAGIHGIELEEDVTFEALKKAEYRYRKRLEGQDEKKTGSAVDFVPPKQAFANLPLFN